MFQAGIITFRETLEASLVVSILLSYLLKTQQLRFSKFVWYGVFLGVLISLILAFILNKVFGGIPEGRPEQISEGILMFVTAAFLTWMILWVHRQKEQIAKMKEKMSKHVTEGFGLGIVLLTTTSVLREGIETVLYLKAISLSSSGNQLAGAGIGILIALVAGWVIFKWMLHYSLSTIFSITGILLLLFAAGLVSHGAHEFQEAGLLPVFSFDPMVNLSSLLDHKGGVGGVLRSLFGYTSKPTVLEFIFYGFYIVGILWLEKFTDRLLLRQKFAKR